MAEFQPEAFGRYYLVDKVAVGGMAEVFKAKSFSTGGFEKLLVIKRILDHLSDNDEFVDMFIDEAKISVELQHPNIVQIYDFGQLGDNYFIAMECVEGKDVKGILRKLAERRKLFPPEFAVYIAHEMCKGLDFAHKKTNLKGDLLGIVHRDVSPSNILVSYTGEVKVADFGIAKAEISLYNTKDGVLKGKFEYMSPEQASAKDTTFRSDIFASGIILHEMLTGRRLFKTDSEVKTLEKVKNVDIPRPSEVNPQISPRLDEIVMKALSKDPADRFEDAKAFQQALFEYLYPNTPDIVRESLKHFMTELFRDEISAENGQLEKGTAIAVEMYESEPEIDLDEEWQEGASVGTQTLVQQSKAPILAILVVLALLLPVIGFLGWKVMQSPDVVVEKAPDPTTGSLQLKVDPAEATSATFFLDGEKLGEGLTLALDEIAPKSGAVLRIEATGYESYEEAVDIVAGERLRQRIILVAIGEEPPPEVPKQTTTAPKQTTTAPKQTTQETAPSGTATEEPAATPGTARFTSTPPSAEVYVNGSMIGRTPTSWKRGSAGESAAVEFRKSGYDTTRFTITFPEDGEAETFKRTLSEKKSTPGKVSVNVKSGWAEVWIDGKKVDTTPLYNHSLTAGAHTIRVTNAQTGMEETKSVTVTAGETLKVMF